VDFDKQAEGYDRQWAKLAPMIGGMHLLIGAILAELRTDARILVVGAGTGAEILYLAGRFPRWRFTAVEPSASRIDILRRRADEAGILSRCELHHGYVESLPPSEPFDAATALLVSQFVLGNDARCDFFRAIGERLRSDALLVSADLAVDTESPAYRQMLEVWLRIMLASDEVPPEAVERLHASYRSDVGLMPAERVAAIIASAGFATPVHFFQAGLIHAWYSRWRPESVDHRA
jgi:tRNA (cmo5U34)-methyltransferase